MNKCLAAVVVFAGAVLAIEVLDGPRGRLEIILDVPGSLLGNNLEEMDSSASLANIVSKIALTNIIHVNLITAMAYQEN